MSDVELTEVDGFRIGDRVGANERTSIERLVAGISKPTVDKWQAGGVIEQIFQHPEKLWTSLQLRYPDGDTGWELLGEIEARVA